MQDQQNGKVIADEASAVYERATSGQMKHNVMLHFAWADFLEVRLRENVKHLCLFCSCMLISTIIFCLTPRESLLSLCLPSLYIGLYKQCILYTLYYIVFQIFFYFTQSRMKAEKAKEVYEKLLANPGIDPTLVYLINKYYACKLPEKRYFELVQFRYSFLQYLCLLRNLPDKDISNVVAQCR